MTDIAVPTRRCSRCPEGVVKPLTEKYFHRTNNPSGFSFWCRDCTNARRRELWAQRDPIKRPDGTVRKIQAARRRALERARRRVAEAHADELAEAFMEELGPSLRRVVNECEIVSHDVYQPDPAGPVYEYGKRVRIDGVKGIFRFQRHCRSRNDEWVEVLDHRKELRSFSAHRLREYQK